MEAPSTQSLRKANDRQGRYLDAIHLSLLRENTSYKGASFHTYWLCDTIWNRIAHYFSLTVVFSPQLAYLFYPLQCSSSPERLILRQKQSYKEDKGHHPKAYYFWFKNRVHHRKSPDGKYFIDKWRNTHPHSPVHYVNVATLLPPFRPQRSIGPREQIDRWLTWFQGPPSRTSGPPR